MIDQRFSSGDGWPTKAMKRQRGYSGFPAILLTFSVLLLVLAIGFVVGRVFVARAYLTSAPTFDPQTRTGDQSEDIRSEGATVPGRVYVPPPPPPEAPPPGDVLALAGGPVEEKRLNAPGTRMPSDVTTADAQPTDEQDTSSPASQGTPAASVPAAPSPVVDKPIQTTPAKKTEPPTSAYAIQIGLFGSLQGARQVVDELARAGYPARIAREKRGETDIYRVLTGRYRTEYAARKALDELRKAGFDAFLLEQ